MVSHGTLPFPPRRACLTSCAMLGDTFMKTGPRTGRQHLKCLAASSRLMRGGGRVRRAATASDKHDLACDRLREAFQDLEGGQPVLQTFLVDEKRVRSSNRTTSSRRQGPCPRGAFVTIVVAKLKKAIAMAEACETARFGLLVRVKRHRSHAFRPGPRLHYNASGNVGTKHRSLCALRLSTFSRGPPSLSSREGRHGRLRHPSTNPLTPP